MAGKKIFLLLVFSVVLLIGMISLEGDVIWNLNSNQKTSHEQIRGGISAPPGTVSALSVTLRGLRRCVTQQEYIDSNGMCRTMPDNIVYTSDYCVDYWITINSSEPGDKYIWKYYRPDGQIYLNEYWEYVYDPVSDDYVYKDSLGQMQFSGPPATLYWGFRTTNMPYMGEWRIEIYENEALLTSENFNIHPGLWINLPLNEDNYMLNQNEYISTGNIPFEAEVPSGSSTPYISWTLTLNYHTSEPTIKFTSEPIIRTFTSQPNETVLQTYQEMGGLLTVQASASINGFIIQAQEVNITITGPDTGIPDSMIDAQLLNLYSAYPTPRLMIGLARHESSYMQFITNTIFGRTYKWPHESEEDHGSHIGLMQVVTQMDRAFSWKENTEYGVAFFLGEKTNFALKNEKQIKDEAKQLYHFRLPDLDPIQRENMTLEAYGPHAKSEVNQHYYYYEVIPLPKNKYKCQWIVNYIGNPGVIDYVNNPQNGVRTFAGQ